MRFSFYRRFPALVISLILLAGCASPAVPVEQIEPENDVNASTAISEETVATTSLQESQEMEVPAQEVVPDEATTTSTQAYAADETASHEAVTASGEVIRAATTTTTVATSRTTTTTRATAAPDTTAKPTASSKTSAATATTTTTTTARPVTTTATAATTTRAPASSDAAAMRQEVLRLVNENRAASGLPALSYRADLQAAADIRANETVKSFSHTRPDGRSCFTVLSDAGITYRAVGENIAYGYRSAEAVMTGWMNSDGHRKNILSANFTGLAVGVVSVNGTLYWTQIFIA